MGDPLPYPYPKDDDCPLAVGTAHIPELPYEPPTDPVSAPDGYAARVRDYEKARALLTADPLRDRYDPDPATPVADRLNEILFGYASERAVYEGNDGRDAFRSGWDAARASMGAGVAEALREAAVAEWAGRKP